jgi:hypothetical protein
VIEYGHKNENWKYPNSYHITQLFIGGNHQETQNSIFINYQTHQNYEIVIKAVIYVPKKILTGICFPNC